MQEKPATPREDMIQYGEAVSVGFPQNDFDGGESPLAVKREDMDEREEILETVLQMEETPLGNSDYRPILENTSDSFRREEILETVLQMEETPFVNSDYRQILENISDSFRQEEILETVHQIEETPLVKSDYKEISEDIPDSFRRKEIEETVDQREETPVVNSDDKRIAEESTGGENSEITEVNVKIVSETLVPMGEVSNTQTPVGTNEGGPMFTKEQLQNIWKLAKELCEARCAYNQKVCRPLRAVNRQLPPKKRKPDEMHVAHCRRGVRPYSKTNGGICTIGRGDDSLYEDPSPWNWGEPLPEEIRQVIPIKLPPEQSTITLVDLESPTQASSTCFGKTSCSLSKKTNARSPVPKILRTSISMTRFKNSEDTAVVVSDSDEELPDFSVKLGVSPRKAEPCSSERFVVSPADGSCTVVHSAVPQQLAPTTRLTVRKRRQTAENRASSSSSQPNVEPHEIVVLGSSDESDDPDVEVVEVSKKPTSSRAPQKPNPTPKTVEESKEWICPICLEKKDNVESIMSTMCGHIFCGPCLESTIKIRKQCPNCRRKLTLRQIHKLYL